MTRSDFKLIHPHVTHNCAHCGKPINRPESELTRVQYNGKTKERRFCGQVCRGKWLGPYLKEYWSTRERKGSRGRPTARIPAPAVLECFRCHQPFENKQHYTSKAKHRFCSVKCRMDQLNESYRQIRSDNNAALNPDPVSSQAVDQPAPDPVCEAGSSSGVLSKR